MSYDEIVIGLTMRFQPLIIFLSLITALLLSAPYFVALALTMDELIPANLADEPVYTPPDFASEIPEPLDLIIKQEMIDESGFEESRIYPQHQLSIIELSESSKPERFSLSGKLLLDETQQNYRDAFEGAELNVEVKFR